MDTTRRMVLSCGVSVMDELDNTIIQAILPKGIPPIIKTLYRNSNKSIDMTTLDTLKAARITAMKAGETARRDTLALILAGIKQVEVDTRSELSETDVIQLLTKMIKQRQESITQYENAGRTELAAIERAEKAIIEEFLPQQVSETEVAEMIHEAIKETGASSVRDMGKVINILRPKLTGRFDMGKVSTYVKIMLGG